MKKLRIAFFVWEYPPKIVGGLGTFAQYVAPEMVKQGHDISLFTMNDQQGTLKTREILGGVEVHRPLIVPTEDIFPLYVTDDLKEWGAKAKFFADIVSYNIIATSKFGNELIQKEGYHFDIISAHDWLSAMAGIIAKKQTGLPLVFHIHSTEQGRTMGNGSQIIAHLERRAMEIADRVITVSNPMEEELFRLGISPKKISVSWNGIDIKRYNPENTKPEEVQALREKYGIEPDDKMILFVGRATLVKGILELVMAMPLVLRVHPKARLVILARGELEGSIRALINRLGLANDVKTRFEFVPEDERILHYAACDVAAFPSHYEPFGIVSLEAMAMEKPVIVGSCGVCGFRDQVISSGLEQTGFHVDGKNPADIAQWGIIAALNNPEASREMGKKGRQRAKEYFTWNKAAKSILNVYQEVIEKKNP